MPPHHQTITRYIWSIADEILRDVYQRGKYRDIILPITVIRRLDAVLEPTKPQVLAARETSRFQKLPEGARHVVLKQAAECEFYNTSPDTLTDLRHIVHPQRLRDSFNAYLNAYSPNVQEILHNFDFRRQIDKLTESNTLGALVAKITSPELNLSPHPAPRPAGDTLPGIDNHTMGTIFEELIRLFNEENNEESGEHWTPRDIVQLMTKLAFHPLANKTRQNQTYLLYDGACGTGGMLTVARDTLRALPGARDLKIHLYGQEINAETYAICKADLLIKGENADNIIGGPKHSTLANDAFPDIKFDFMLSNPPYGKNWKKDQQQMGGKNGITDPRFRITRADDPDYSLVTAADDGQLLFLANKLSKIKHDGPAGSRIAHIHNGSALFKGAAGSGESNIRRLIIENDWLEAVIALPQNIFYNTGIPTYIWIIANRKPSDRRGKIQLINAADWYQPLRRNLGSKNCELSPQDIQRICAAHAAFAPGPHSVILDNADLGYTQIAVNRPLRHPTADPARVHTPAEIKQLQKTAPPPAAPAPPVITKRHPPKTAPDPTRGRYPATLSGKKAIVEYAADPTLRDHEQIPLNYPGGIPNYLKTEIHPHAPDAWLADEKHDKIGYELNFNRYFYRPHPTRPLSAIGADIRTLQKESDRLLNQILAATDAQE